MVIYGTALLSFCLIAGLVAGRTLGWFLGIDANVGGVGIAMLLLILLTDRFRSYGWLAEKSEFGITFWSAIYIPIVVAMAASQNVLAAVRGGIVAAAAGVLVVVVSLACVPIISRIGADNVEATTSAIDSSPKKER